MKGSTKEGQEHGVKLIATFFVLMLAGLILHKMLDNHVLFDNKTEEQKKRLIRLFASAYASFALYLATKITFPESFETLAVLSFGLFFMFVLMLSKRICRDKVHFVSGEMRGAFLFIMSALLLIQQVPGRMTILVFLAGLLGLWGVGFLKSWRKSRFQGISSSVKRNSLLSPLLIIALFGYGRLACVIAIIWSMGVFIRAFGSVWAQILFLRTEMSLQLNKGLVRSLAVPAGWAVAFGIVFYWLGDFFGQSALDGALNFKLSWKDYSISAGEVVSLAILFFMTKQCVEAFRVSIEYVGSRWARGKRGAVPSIQTLFSYGIWSLYALVSLRVLGLSLTSITVIAGGLSVGIGFGLQNIVNNFIGGLILLFGRSIQQGDVIELSGLWCTVRKINIRTTLVETFENAVIMIPNSDLVTTQVTNWTKNNSMIRRDIMVGVAYGSDIEKVKKVLAGIAAEHPHVLGVPEPYIHFNDFGASSLDFILRVWIDDIDVTLRTMSELRFAIDKEFREQGIEIAFPQMDLHLKSTPALSRIMQQGES